MIINICLPYLTTHAQGGYKMVYEYANRLAQDGNKVTIYYVCKNNLSKYPIPEFIKMLILHRRANSSLNWFKLDNTIKKKAIREINNSTINDGDIVFATGVSTAKGVNYLNSNKGRKFYFIQGFETWVVNEADVISSYGMGMNNIVVSKWLRGIVDQYSTDSSIYIPNAIDVNKFKIINPISNRSPYNITLLYNTLEGKGIKYALESLKNIKEKYPRVQVEMFGTEVRGIEIPDWVSYTQNASAEQLIEIYNNTAIFVCASIEEGFGLTGAESMACGCALVASEYQGVFEYAKNDENALLSPVMDVEAMTNNIEKLILDDEMRIRLASNGNRFIQELSWEKAYSKFIKCIN